MVLSEAETRLASAMALRHDIEGAGVLDEVARLFRIGVSDITGPDRKRAFVDARSVAAIILRRRGYTLVEVGMLIGSRDHSTIWNLINRVEHDHELKALCIGLAS